MTEREFVKEWVYLRVEMRSLRNSALFGTVFIIFSCLGLYRLL